MHGSSVNGFVHVGQGGHGALAVRAEQFRNPSMQNEKQPTPSQLLEEGSGAFGQFHFQAMIPPPSPSALLPYFTHNGSSPNVEDDNGGMFDYGVFGDLDESHPGMGMGLPDSDV